MEKEIISDDILQYEEHDQNLLCEELPTQDLITMTTNNFAVFEVIFDVLNKFTDEITISFRNNCIKIIFTDTQQPFFESNGAVMIFIKINSDNIENYQTRTINNEIKFNLRELCEFIEIGQREKQIKKSDVFSIRVDNTKIYFDFTNVDKESTFTHNQHILNDNNINQNFPTHANFVKLVIMECSTFFKTCKILASDNAVFSCSTTFVIDNGSSSRTFRPGNHAHIVSLDTHSNITTIGNYNLNHIIKCDRMTKIGDECQIYLHNNCPLFLHLNIGPIGKMLIGLSPNE